MYNSRFNFISLFFLMLLFCCSNNSYAQQEFEVLGFKKKPLDQRARINKKQNTNGENCAIIALVTDLSDIGFNGNLVDAEYNQQGEWLIWISPDANSLIISKTGFFPLEYIFPVEIKIEPLKVYELKLTKKTDFIVEDLYELSFNFNVTEVYVSRDFLGAVKVDDYNTTYSLPKKKYRFNFKCNGFKSKEIVINLNNDTTVNITLERGESDINLRKVFFHLTTEPDQVNIFLNGQEKGLSSKTITLLPGNYLIRLEKKYYKTINDSISILNNMSKPYELTSWFGNIQLNVTPTNASITLDNKNYENGERKKVECGYHYIKITHKTHETFIDSILINNNDDIRKEISLIPIGGYLNITSNPSNAIVFIDGDSAGTTNFYSEWLKSAKYEIKLLADYDLEYKEYKWGPNIFDINIKNGKTINKTVNLYKNYADLTIISAGATIYLNNKIVGYDSVSIELPPKKIFKIKAVKIKHKNDELSVKLGRGEKRKIELRPIPRNGTLYVSGSPYNITEGAEIWINGRKTDKVLPANFELLYGVYTFTLKCPVCLDKSEEIEIIEGEETDKEISMICIKDSAEVVEKIHKIRFISSFVPPGGIGHFYGANEGKGFLYFTTNTAAIMSSIYITNYYYKLIIQYNQLNENIANTPTMSRKLPLYEERKELGMKINDAYIWKNVSYGLSFFLYALNITDAYFTNNNEKKFYRINKRFAKKQKNSKITLYPVNKGLMLGFNYNF